MEHHELAGHILNVPFEMKNVLPKLRAQKGWSQAELAAHLKVSRQTINAIETERYEPSLSLAFAIAQLFEKSVEEIFGRKCR